MKVLISDIDKTLYFNNEENPIRLIDKDRIELFQSTGNLFGVCTGRSYSGVQKFIESYGMKFDFMILSSGAIIMDQKHQLIKKLVLKREVISTIINLVKDDVIQYSMTKDKRFYCYGHPDPAYCINDFNQVEGDEFDSFALMFEDLDKLEHVANLLNQTFGDSISVHRNLNNLDISPKGCSKGNAIKELQRYLGVTMNDIYVIGDSYNDISMFRAVRNSCSFHMSPEEVKNEVLYLVNSIADVIDYILFNAPIYSRI